MSLPQSPSALTLMSSLVTYTGPRTRRRAAQLEQGRRESESLVRITTENSASHDLPTVFSNENQPSENTVAENDDGALYVMM